MVVMVVVMVVMTNGGDLTFGAQSWRPMAARNMVRDVYSALSSSDESGMAIITIIIIIAFIAIIIAIIAIIATIAITIFMAT